MNTSKRLDVLEDKVWSSLWQRYYESATSFDPLKVQVINCIIPNPREAGALIFSDEGISFSQMNPQKTLRRFASAHCFPEYKILSRCLKNNGNFGKYKFPWVCAFFALFPLEGSETTIWLNPAKIVDLKKTQESYYVAIENGPKLTVPIHRRRIISNAEVACLVLATMRRGHFHFITKGTTPLDFLELPDTPFAKVLRGRLSLQYFRTPIGELNRLYNKAYSLYHCNDLIENREAVDRIGWY